MRKSGITFINFIICLRYQWFALQPHEIGLGNGFRIVLNDQDKKIYMKMKASSFPTVYGGIGFPNENIPFQCSLYTESSTGVQLYNQQR